MKPIVLVGGGENHYHLIQKLGDKKELKRPIILVAKRNKHFPLKRIPEVVAGLTSFESCQMDMWKACQRAGVYFLKDECTSINRDEKVVFLKKYGKLEFHCLSIETQTEPFITGLKEQQSPSLMVCRNPALFIEQLNSFFAEVHKHCPREIRVVVTGLSQESLRLACVLNQELMKSCGSVDLVMVREITKNQKPLTKSVIKSLKTQNIRVIENAGVESLRPHQLKLTDGKDLDFDVLIPWGHWRSQDFLGKILQADNSRIYVGKDLKELKEAPIFISGANVYFENESLGLCEIESFEIKKVLETNVFLEDFESPHIQCRTKKKDLMKNPFFKKGLEILRFAQGDGASTKKGWKVEIQKQLKSEKDLPLLELAAQKRQENLVYEAEHMSRPWRGLLGSEGQGDSKSYRLTSYNGFNCWGSYTESTLRIVEVALLKAFTRGVNPAQLRFSLTLPRTEEHLTKHIFESTFRAIEEVTAKHGVEIDGGDTFDGNHWHLAVTIGGRSERTVAQRFESHDYLLITRPLGFGFLWAARHHDKFDSDWIQNSFDSQLLVDFKKWDPFFEKFAPSSMVLVEEWGFLYHCLQSLPAHQQLMLNFREIPRWTGIDQTLTSKSLHPGLEANWSRISGDVAFARDEVSLNNAVLWDSLSQGSLVIGVKAKDYKQALCHLHEMGYKRAALVGCVRPKAHDNKVVLSDWTPQ